MTSVTLLVFNCLERQRPFEASRVLSRAGRSRNRNSDMDFNRKRLRWQEQVYSVVRAKAGERIGWQKMGKVNIRDLKFFFGTETNRKYYF